MMKGILENEFTVCDTLRTAGLFLQQRSFISVINLSIQNIQSNAACRRISTCLLVSVGIGHRFSKEMYI